MSEELEKITHEDVFLKIAGKERKIKFGFSAWAKIEQKYGGLQNLGNIQKDIQEKPFETIPELIYLALSDKDGVDKDTMLDDYGLADMEMIAGKLTAAMYGSLPQEKKKAVQPELIQ